MIFEIAFAVLVFSFGLTSHVLIYISMLVAKLQKKENMLNLKIRSKGTLIFQGNSETFHSV